MCTFSLQFKCLLPTTSKVLVQDRIRAVAGEGSGWLQT